MDSPWTRTERARRAALGLAIVLVPALGVADFFSGTDATFEAFYMVPVLLTSWYAGGRAGFVVSLACVASRVVADLLLPGRWSDRLALEAWNSASQLGIYVFACWLVTALQAMLDARTELIGRLETAMREIRTLRGLLPICAWCKRIRDGEDDGDWKSVELYVASHTEAEFTHGICPDCAANVMSEARDGR